MSHNLCIVHDTIIEQLCENHDTGGTGNRVSTERGSMCAGLKNISVPSSQDAMIEAILKERRLEAIRHA